MFNDPVKAGIHRRLLAERPGFAALSSGAQAMEVGAEEARSNPGVRAGYFQRAAPASGKTSAELMADLDATLARLGHKPAPEHHPMVKLPFDPDDAKLGPNAIVRLMNGRRQHDPNVRALSYDQLHDWARGMRQQIRFGGEYGPSSGANDWPVSPASTTPRSTYPGSPASQGITPTFTGIPSEVTNVPRCNELAQATGKNEAIARAIQFLRGASEAFGRLPWTTQWETAVAKLASGELVCRITSAMTGGA